MAASDLLTIFTEQFILEDIWQGSEYDSIIVSWYKKNTFCHRIKFHCYKQTSLQKRFWNLS